MIRIHLPRLKKPSNLWWVVSLLLTLLFSATPCLTYGQVSFPEGNNAFAKKIVPLGDGWASNTINTVIFRHHGIVTSGTHQFTAFYDAKRTVTLVQRNLENDKLIFHVIPGKYDLSDAHNAISMGIDSLGFLHISYGQHGSKLCYRRSTEPLSINSWTSILPMTGRREGKITYPTFVHGINQANHHVLLFLFRDGTSEAGEACLKEYSPFHKVWTDREPSILSGSQQRPWTSCPYWNHPVIDSKGRMHVSFVWRAKSILPEKRVNNINIDYAYSDNCGHTWFTSNCRTLQSPITQVNSETIRAVSPGSNLINQTGMAVDSNNHPHIVFYSDDKNHIPQYQHLWFDGNTWHHNYISNRKTPFVLQGMGTQQLPISRPEIVIDSRDRVYVIYRGDFTNNRMVIQRLTPPRYEPEQSETKILWPETVAFAEPVIDRTRWKRDRILTMFIQQTAQPPHDRQGETIFKPAFLVDWDIRGDWNQ